jgi:hypothetical protein
MTDILQQTMEIATRYETVVMTWGPPVVLLILALLFSYTTLSNWLKEQFLYRSIRKLGVAALRNIVIPDGMDGRVLIENIILTPNGIYILPIKRYCGIIFAADNIDTWSQIIGKRSYKFSNPLRELETYIMALRNLLPAVNIAGCILVTRDAEFPKGKPERVIPIEAAAELLGITKGEIPEQLKQAWDNLKAAGLELNIEEKRSMKHFDDGDGYTSQHVISIGLLCAALGWLVWHLWNPVWN